MRDSKDLQMSAKFEFQNPLAASQFHRDFWNARFGWSDRFCSTMYAFNDETHRWQKAEVINW
jgi:hypothetical protein